MNELLVRAEHAYPVVIGCTWRTELAKFCEGYARVGIVVSAAMRQRVGDLGLAQRDVEIFEIPDGEAGKSIQTLQLLWDGLASRGFTRSDLVVGIGGGSTTDIAGFAAATWLRGISWVAIPTTLAGMVDAAVGGKTGMNSTYGKNLIGSFHSPSSVFIDFEWLDSISDRDFSAGLAEVIKCGFVADPKILDIVESHSLSAIRSDISLIEDLVSRSLKVKADVVGEDFRDNFAREILNYGHTLGHGIELHSKYSLRHGEAVSIGMVFAAELAHLRKVLNGDIVGRHRLLLEKVGLPISYRRQALAELLPLLLLDKKTRGRNLRFVAISDIATPLRLEEVTEEEISRAYEKVSS